MTAATPALTSGRTTAVTPLRLAVAHARYGFLETVRVPIAVVGTALFPALALIFFVVPQEAVAGDPLIAAGATAQLAVFSVMSTAVFTHGIGVAEDRALPFDAFLRTLPAGPGPRIAGRVLTGTAFSALGVLPLLLVGATLTEASVPVGRLLLSLVLLVVVSTPFLLIGLSIGYGLSAKAATAVAQVVVFPLAFAGGMFAPPESFPAWLDGVSQTLPSRAARDVVVSVVVGETPPASALVVLVAWTAAFAALAAVVYRRDEGRRFR